MVKQLQILICIIVFVIGSYNHTYACHVPDENMDSSGDIAENWKIDAINCHDESEFWQGAFIGAVVIGILAVIGTTIYYQDSKKSVQTIKHPKVTPTIKPKKKEIGTIYTFRF